MMSKLSRRLFLTSLVAVPALVVGVRLPTYVAADGGSAVFRLVRAKMAEAMAMMRRNLDVAMYVKGDTLMIGTPPSHPPSPTFTPRYYEVSVDLETV